MDVPRARGVDQCPPAPRGKQLALVSGQSLYDPIELADFIRVKPLQPRVKHSPDRLA